MLHLNGVEIKDICNNIVLLYRFDSAHSWSHGDLASVLIQPYRGELCGGEASQPEVSQWKHAHRE